MDREREIKRARIFNYTVASLFLLLFVSLFALLGVWKWSRTFTVRKWTECPEDRHKIVSNLIAKHTILGMSEQEIVSLLGEEYENAPERFKLPRGEFPDESTLTYYLGVDFMDTAWLIIPMENGVAVDCRIGVT